MTSSYAMKTAIPYTDNVTPFAATQQVHRSSSKHRNRREWQACWSGLGWTEFHSKTVLLAGLF